MRQAPRKCWLGVVLPPLLVALAGCGDDVDDSGGSRADSATTPRSTTRTIVGESQPVESAVPTIKMTSRNQPLAPASGPGGVDGPVVFAADSMVAEEALGEGTVELEGQCLMLGLAPQVGGGRRVIVWEYGTSWDADLMSIVLPDGRLVAIGARITAGGGYHGSDLAGFVTDEDALEHVRSCIENESTDNVFVIQSRVDVHG